MDGQKARGRHRRGLARPALLVAIGLAAGVMVMVAMPRPEATNAPHAALPTGSAAPVAALPRRATSVGRHVQPTKVQIPAIGVASPLVDLALNRDRTLQAPGDFARAGWYAGGSAPGDAGAPAVIAGHVDSYRGPAVFYHLGELKAGSEILVTGIDGKVRRFKVYRAAQYDKDAFPADQVYAPTVSPELRLITCTGDFDRDTGSYLSNLVVYAQYVAGG
jgi:LPXTG-site transpeptidase (sortase) family protein